MPIKKLISKESFFFFLGNHDSWKLLMQTWGFWLNCFFFELECMWKKAKRKKMMRCIRASTACERRRRIKLSKEVCQVLPSPVCMKVREQATFFFLFFFIWFRVHIYIYIFTSGRYTWERKRVGKDIQSSSVTTTKCGFSFSHHQRRRTEHVRERREMAVAE